MKKLTNKPKAIEIGEANFSITIDDAEVDELLERIERSVAAFKKEWKREKF
jgi:hypothetical protein